MQRRRIFRPSTLLVVLTFLTVGSFPTILSTSQRILATRYTAVPIIAGQTRERKVQTQIPEVVKVDVDLVTVDALVLRKDNSRIVGDLTRDDFTIYEDGKLQDITHFNQGSLPLSVLLMIDRGGCLDPFGSNVRHAALAALAKLRSDDEVAVMTYHNSAELLQPFTENRALIENALNRVPPHDEDANHCLDKAFLAAGNYMERAANPSGRRVVIFITGVTRNFACEGGPGAKTAVHAIYESGSIVCTLIPVSPDQKVENGVMIWATRVGGAMKVPTLNLKDVTEETGGEYLQDKPEHLDHTFATLIDNLRSRFSLAFVSSNKARDGGTRVLKVGLKPAVEKSRGKLVVKARHSYIAPRS